MHIFSRSAKQTLGLLAVDNIHLSSQGLNLFAAVDRGEMTTDDAKEAIKKRAYAYAATGTTVIARIR
jgi:hypothetical protein